MAATEALYSEDDSELAEAIIASLSRQVFDEDLPKPASRIRRALAWLTYRILKRTTKKKTLTNDDGEEVVVYRSPVLEKSKHPYALTLLEPNICTESAKFVAGGNPMNAPYMMICPEIRGNSETWDKLLLNSVHGQDVQLRFVWEARITYEKAKRRLDEGNSVRMKAVAAGTGLSMILVFDRLVRDGYDPGKITATVSDRDASNIEKARRLMRKLSSTKDHFSENGGASGITAHTEDLMHPVTDEDGDAPQDVVTIVGILEYFRGFTYSTAEEHLGQPVTGDESGASDVLRKVAAMTCESGTLIANSYRLEIGARILEIFGKHLRYRNVEDLHALFESEGFHPTGTSGSGHVYDVVAYARRTPEG